MLLSCYFHLSFIVSAGYVTMSFLFNILLGFIVNVITAFKTSFCCFREKQFDTGHFLKSTVQYNLKLCMWKVAEAARFLIGHPQYVSSQPVPTWTRSSEYTCGASWRVWDTKPQRKAIATTGQYRNTSIIATLRSGQKVYYWITYRNT